MEGAEKTVDLYRVGIVGPGAVGQALAGHLGNRGVPHVAIGRGDGRSGLAACALVFFTVKAYSLRDALTQTLPALAKDTVVVVCCNGDVESVIKPFQEAHSQIVWRRGLVTFGARVEQGRMVMVGEKGRLVFGGESPRPVETWLASRSERILFDLDIEEKIVGKWITNTAINTVAAAYGLSCNGEIEGRHAEEFGAALKEAIAFAKKRWPDVSIDESLISRTVYQVLADTAANENSMAADVRFGRPTEVDFLSGLVPREEKYQTLGRLTDQIRTRATRPQNLR